MASFIRTATIENGQQLSDPINCSKGKLVGFFTPAALTGTAITFFVCDTEDGTYVELQTGGGSALSATVSASKYISVDHTKFVGIGFVKLRSGSAEGAARAIRCLVEK